MIARSQVISWVAAVVLPMLAGPGVSAAPGGDLPKHEAPIPTATLALMRAKDTTPAAPILIRIYKKEAELEVWKKARSGRFVLLKTFPICRWSGQLGPKRKQGDRQTPEGFYTIMPKQMNPNSAYYLSFNIGYPNAYDRAHGGSGAHLMVHGTCSSAGCYAMTDGQITEIYALAREAFAGGQPAFQFQAYPFRMTAENMVKYRSDPNIGFWRQLKEGSDRFEATGEEPVVSVSAGRYVFKPAKDSDKEARTVARRSEEEARIAALTDEGRAAIRTTYADGGQHPLFIALLRQGAYLGEVSRPEALALAGREIVVIPAHPKQPACPGHPGCPTQMADAKGSAPIPSKVWPVAPALASIQGALPPLADEPSVFAFAPLDVGSATVAAKPAIPGSLRVLPAHFAARTPVTFNLM
jgi:murein L,D-transpeptidase YafK